MRLSFLDDQDPDRAGDAVQRRLAAVTGSRDFPDLVSRLEQTRQAVREIFRDVLSDG
jgi:hypothetical protein